MLRTSHLVPSSLALLMLALTGCGGGAAVVETDTTVETQEPPMATASLIIGGGTANFGIHELTTGFLPDPATFDVLSGGNLDAADAVAGTGCTGFVTAQPDVIINIAEMSGFLRFAFRPANEGDDTTILVNDGNGNWHCNDDSIGLNPMVDLADAPPGQYDIWVGSYEASANIQGQLLVTELEDVTP